MTPDPKTVPIRLKGFQQLGLDALVTYSPGENVSSVVRDLIPDSSISYAMQYLRDIESPKRSLAEVIGEMPQRYMRLLMETDEEASLEYQIEVEAGSLPCSGRPSVEYNRALAELFRQYLSAKASDDECGFNEFEYRGVVFDVILSPDRSERDIEILKLQIKNLIDKENDTESDTESDTE